jgi:DNA-directed RNA polymerase specialized sigma24 family protein
VYKRQEGKSSKEIAREMGIAVGTVDNHISEALRILRELAAGKDLLLYLSAFFLL